MILRVAAVTAAAAVLSAVFAFRAAGKMPDFEVYWTAGARAAAAEPLYREGDGHYQLKYLPAFAMLAVPAAHLPLPVAKAIWFAASAGTLWLLLALSLRLLPARHKPAWALLTLTVLALAKFYGHELVLGQVNLLFAAAAAGAVLLEARGRPLAAGLLVALAIVIKPYAVIFVPWLAARGSYRAASAAAAGIGITLLLPAAIYGLDGAVSLHRAWWTTVTGSTAPNLLNADNVSLAAMYAKWLGPGRLAAMLAAGTGLALLAAAAVVVLAGRGARSAAGLEGGLLLVAIPLLSPQGWDYVFLISTPAVMYLINYERGLPAPLRVVTIAALAAVAFSLYDLMGRQAYAAFMQLSVITVCFMVVAGALVALRLRRIA